MVVKRTWGTSDDISVYLNDVKGFGKTRFYF